ncbi:hypothetical protein [Streptomyces sp. NPDC086787]|uniref:hypothetical protein n=1 Tax=Streptomyces sp. NPDC086787 TaxID=3365759 RepID=UPI003822E806
MSTGPASAAPAGTHASAARQIGTMKEWAGGIPKSVHRGGTIHLTMSYTQNSRDTLLPLSFGLSLWNFSAPGEKQLRGVSATWWNPGHRRWEKASHQESNGFFGFDIPDDSTVRLAPGKVGHVYVRVTFGKTAYTGKWHFEPMVSAYQLVTPKGKSDNNFLSDSRRQYATTLRR